MECLIPIIKITEGWKYGDKNKKKSKMEFSHFVPRVVKQIIFDMKRCSVFIIFIFFAKQTQPCNIPQVCVYSLIRIRFQFI